MADSQYERLSALDAAFLSMEQEGAHMHVGALVRLRGEDAMNEHGGVDYAQLRGHLKKAVHEIPRLRQRVEKTPGFGHPVWVDDPHFQLDYHVRHAALPRPGDEDQLKRLAGRIFSQRLDRRRPLWEMWIVEGLEGGGFAMVTKIHHCMMDGVGAVNLMSALVSAATKKDADDDVPHDTPSRRELWWGELKHRYGGLQKTMQAAREVLTDTREGKVTGAADITRGIRGAFESGLSPVTHTCINTLDLSPHRRFETLRFELSDVKAVKNALGGTVNDVVLATVTGALHRYLTRHGEDVQALERFRAMLPANVRNVGNDGTMGNRTSLLIAALPIAEQDPIERLAKVRAETEYLKNESNEIAGAEFIERLDDGLGLGIVTASFKLAVSLHSFNLIVTNVPGPPFALPLFDAKVEAIHALVPLFGHQALGIALFSYAGGLYWGFNADYDTLPDLSDLVQDTRDAFAELQKAAGVGD